MSTTARELLEAFDRLPEAERREIALEILRRAWDQNVPSVSDDELTLAAEERFAEIDAVEARR